MLATSVRAVRPLSIRSIFATLIVCCVMRSDSIGTADDSHGKQKAFRRGLLRATLRRRLADRLSVVFILFRPRISMTSYTRMSRVGKRRGRAGDRSLRFTGGVAEVFDEARSIVQRDLGIDPSRVLMSATHTHSAVSAASASIASVFNRSWTNTRNSSPDGSPMEFSGRTIT